MDVTDNGHASISQTRQISSEFLTLQELINVRVLPASTSLFKSASACGRFFGLAACHAACMLAFSAVDWAGKSCRRLCALSFAITVDSAHESTLRSSVRR